MPPELGQFTFKWTLQGQECRNVFYCVHRTGEDVSDFEPATLVDTANHLGEAYADSLLSLTSSSAQLYGIDAVGNTAVGTGPLIETAADSVDLPYNGTDTPGVTANNVTLACRMQTGFGGRGNHGRFYFVGIGPGVYDSTHPNFLKAGSVADFATQLAAFQNSTNSMSLDTGSAQLVVASFILDNADRVPAVYNPVQAINLFDINFDSQRRRLASRGI